MTSQKDTGAIRELALDVLIEVLEKGGYSHKVIGACLKNHQYFTKQDRAFLTRLTEGTIEHVIELDYIINQFSKVKVKKMKPVIRTIIRMGVYQIKYMNQVPDSAACNEAVKLAKKRGFRTLTGFVNGVLRNVSRDLEMIHYPDQMKEPIQYLSVVYSTPEWIVEQWLNQYTFDTVEQMLKASFEEKQTTIRCNLSKISMEQLKEILIEEGVTVNKGSYLDCAYKISNYNYLARLESFQKGYYQVQDESSMLIGKIADIKENQLVLDVCAAPGGKSLHAADLLHGTGKVIARDLTEDKVRLIKENCQRIGYENVTVQLQDATQLDNALVGKVDVLIADVPCSGLGVFGKKTDIKYKMSKEQQQDLVQLQREILKTVVTYVKPGGTMIYSTCTVHPKENEENMKWIMEHYGFHLDSIDPFIADSLKNETTKVGYLQLLPGVYKTDGFFMARLVKD